MAAQQLSFEELKRWAQVPQHEYGLMLNEERKVLESSVFGCVLHDSIVAAGNTEGRVYCWDAATKYHCGAEPTPEPPTAPRTSAAPFLDARVGGIYAMAVVDAGRPLLAVGGDRGVSLTPWRPGDWAAPKVFQAPSPENPDGSRDRPSECNALAVDGKFLLCGDGDGCVRKRDVETGQVVAAPKAHEDMLLALSFAPEAGVVATAAEDGDACLLDFRQADAVVKRFSGVCAAARATAEGAAIKAAAEGGSSWCGAVYVDPGANWVTVAGGVESPPPHRATMGGWLATMYAPTGAVARCCAQTAPIRVLQPDPSTSRLLAAGDDAYVYSFSLADATKCQPLKRTRYPMPAIYSLCVAPAPPRLAAAHGLEKDDFGTPHVVFAGGAAPHVAVAEGDRQLHMLTLLNGEELP